MSSLSCPTTLRACIMPPGDNSITFLKDGDFALPVPYSYEENLPNRYVLTTYFVEDEWAYNETWFEKSSGSAYLLSIKSQDPSYGYLYDNPFGAQLTEMEAKPTCHDTDHDYRGRPVITLLKATGNPAACCLNNMFCTQENPENMYLDQFPGMFDPNCFNVNADGKGRTCPFDYRRLGDNSSCYSEMFKWCTTSDEINGKTPPANINMPNKWVDPLYTFDGIYQDNGGIADTKPTALKTYPKPCTNFFLTTLYSTALSGNNEPSKAGPLECPVPGQSLLSILNDLAAPPIPNPVQYQNAKNVFTTAVRNYLEAGGSLDALEGESGSNQEFNQNVYQICQLYPSMCTEFLKDFCQNKSPEDLVRNPASATFCGCYLNPTVYEDILGKFGVNTECSPYCNAQGVIPLSDGTFSGSLSCNQSVCLIDNISVDMVKSRVEGNINISNLCGNCGTPTVGATSGSSCQCILDNITVTAVNTSINTINLNQSCAGNVCYKTEKGSDKKIAVDCNTGNLIETTTERNEKNAQLIHNLKIIGLIILFVILLIIFFFVIGPSNIIPSIKKVFYPDSKPAVSNRNYTSILSRN